MCVYMIVCCLHQEAHSAVSLDDNQSPSATVFAAPTGIPDHIANSLNAGRKSVNYS